MIELKNNPAGNFFLLAGPCVIEGEDMAMRIAERVVAITDKLQIPYVFKGSYRKANRSRLDSFMGIGDEKALKILKKVHDTFGVPTVTDIHAAEEAAMAAEYVDILQIPAFLCRQTDLLVAAAKTGKTVNIKKGQFLSPLAMQFAADKVVEAGNKNVMITERGTTFGYQDLVVDYRGIPEMQTFGFLVFRTHFPIFGKVIADAIGDNADSDVLFIFRVGKHYAVDCIVQCTVTSYNDNGAVTVVGKYACQTFYGAEPFGLHIVVRHAFAVHICFNLFPPFLHFARSGFGVIDYAPFIGFYTHISVSFNRSNIFINLPLKRCCRQRY